MNAPLNRRGAGALRKLFLCLALLGVTASLRLDGATISGIVRDRRGNLVSTNINFRSIQRPIFTTPWIQPGWTVSTNSAGDGTFAISLTPGDYGVSIGSDLRDAFVISVPNTSSNYTLSQVITSRLTYTFPYSPSYEQTVNRDAPGGYPTLDGGWGRVPSWILGTNAPGVGFALYSDGTYNYWAAAGGGGGGEANTASSVGVGVGAFKGKSGVDLQFKSFKGTNGTTISTNANEVLVDASAVTNGVPVHSQLVSLSNAVAAIAVANDTTTSNALRTAYLASDITTSNGAVVATMTASNNVQAQILNSSNVLQAATALKQDADSDLAAVAGQTGTGIITRTGTGTATTRTITAGSSRLTVSNGDGVAANPILDVSEANLSFGAIGSALAASNSLRAYIDLAASNRVAVAPGSNITVATNSASGIMTFTINAVGSGSGDVTTPQLNSASNALAAANLTTSNGVLTASRASDNVTSNALVAAKQDTDTDLTAVAGLSGTGLITRTASGTATTRTITAGSSKISVSNGDGVASNPTLDVTEANIILGNLNGGLSTSNALRSYIDLAASNRVAIAPGSGVVITTNGSGGVTTFTIASTGGGGGLLQTNASQFGSSVVLSIKDGVALTNPVVEGGITFTANSGVVIPATGSILHSPATANSLAGFDVGKKLYTIPNVSVTEAGYLDGVTGPIQTALDAKLTNNDTRTVVIEGNLTANSQLFVPNDNVTLGGGSTLIIDGSVSSASTNIIHLMPEDAAPATNDFVMSQDISANGLRKLKLNNLPVSHAVRTLVTLASNGVVNFAQPYDVDLADIAALSGQTAFGQGFLQLASATTAKSYIGVPTDITTTSNALRIDYIGKDTTTSNGAVAFTMTASNAVHGSLLSASNALRADYIGKDTTTSNGAVAFTMAASNNIATGFQPIDGDLTSIAGLSAIGAAFRMAAGNWVIREINGSANEISVANVNGVTGNPTISFATTIDLGGKISLEIPNGSSPTVDSFGEIAGDNDAWAAGRGAPVFYDGTSAVRLLGTLATDTPANGQVPVWNTGGTITWENQGVGSGEANANGEAAVTNATRIGLVNGKSGVTNLLRSIEAGANITLVNDGTNIVIASSGGGGGSTNGNPVLAAGSLMVSNVFQFGITNAGTNAAITVDWNGPRYLRHQLNGNTTYSLTNPPAAGTPGRSFTLELAHVGVSSTVTIQTIGPIGINWQDGAPVVLANRTNLLDIVWNGTNFIGSSRQDTTTGSGSVVLSNAPVILSATLSGQTDLAAVTNLTTEQWRVETRLTPTNNALSNIVVNFALTNTVELWITNNITFTNWSGVSDAGAASVLYLIRPQLINRGVNFGNLGLSNPGFGVAIATNMNAPLWTTLTNGKTYALAITRIRTNLFPTLTLWE